MSEEDLDLLVTLDDPGEEEEDIGDHLQIEDTVIGDGRYPLVFSQGDWTCAVSKLTATTNDSGGGPNGDVTGLADQKFEIDVCLVTCSKDGKIVEQKVFYGLDRMQKPIGVK